ncbi:hypothetical protein GGI15_001835 [Coemansia interrupta]|uniref:Broad specificity phosphatase PhoE n=1 Tax=Coemansia interrupta TaxID=1126814 RepID=A0A9W8HJV6_9FUNG|nr:hypothetical protein GGI15_001835 [Coemansia interrupta]
MTPIPLPEHTLTCYFVRHGERVDHIDDEWAQTAHTPYDPPLTPHGLLQARQTGALIHALEHQDKSDAASETEYLVLTSPFQRCAQTAEALAQGFRQKSTRTARWSVAVEPGLSEVMSEGYFDAPVPDSLIGTCIQRVRQGSVVYDEGYEVARSVLPRYPEDFQQMMARFVSTLDCVASRQVGLRMRRRAEGLSDPRRVVIMVTHGAGVGALLWATTMRPAANNVDYCAVTRADVQARRSSRPLARFGSSRIPAFSWTVGPYAYSGHTANL